MSEFESEVKKAERELEQGLVPAGGPGFGHDDEFLGDLKMQAQEYGHRVQDAAIRAKDMAAEKFRDLQGKDPRELLEDAKDYARQKPAQALMISAAVGLVVGFLLKRR
ncbi:MAG: DUF883 family protein [Blastocatellia bacterium]|nr:DUF883 family protein [Blastocatellia bacterium]